MLPGIRVARSVNSYRDAGLTTLEWLLIIAAVAGLAALGVVLVQNQVSTTSGSIRGISARQVAADIATTDLTRDWQAEHPETEQEADQINRAYARRCRSLGVIYSDIELDFTFWNGVLDTSGGWLHTPGCALV